jgi:hypothetical protein
MHEPRKLGKADEIRLEPDLDEIFFCAAGKRHDRSVSIIMALAFVCAKWRLRYIL